MFGIGGGEFIFILFIILMFFGSDKIPELARTLGKGMAQLKNATNDIKSEISKGMENSGIDPNALTGGITDEINKAKEGFAKMVQDSGAESVAKSEIDQIRENFAKLNQAELVANNPETELAAAEIPKIPETTENEEGPIKRQR